MFVTHLLAGLAAAQSGVVTANTVPPPIVVAVEPPMPPVIRATTAMPQQPRVVVPVHVRVAAGNQVLFDDTLRVARSVGASFSQSRSEAPETVCATPYFYGSDNRNSLNVQLYLREDAGGAPAISVNVSWQRPGDSTQCGTDGTRSVSMSQSLPLGPGQSATVRGDAGLVVTLSRR
jgi:hypothetical protein